MDRPGIDTRASAVRGRQLTAWAMARPLQCQLFYKYPADTSRKLGNTIMIEISFFKELNRYRQITLEVCSWIKRSY
jgi:hypothetical protein